MSNDKKEFAERVARKYSRNCGIQFSENRISDADYHIRWLEAIEAVREEDARSAVASMPAVGVTVADVKRLINYQIDGNDGGEIGSPREFAVRILKNLIHSIDMLEKNNG